MSLASTIDAGLDLTVVGGYSRVGYQLRRRGWSALPSMDGRVVMVTGGGAGLGKAAAQALARLGATVWLVVRDERRGEMAADHIRRAAGHDRVEVGICDLSDLRAVSEFAARFNREADRLDVLVHNAGVLTPQRRLSGDGLELTLATNVLSPLLLTRRLAPQLRAGARVITVSSGGMYTQRVPVDDLQSQRGQFDGAAVYARTKRAQVILTELGAARLAPCGIVAHAMHPGWVDTPGLRRSLPRFHQLMRPLLRTPQQGADTIVWLAAAPEPALSTGGFWHDRRRRPTHLLPWTRESDGDRRRLWDECEHLIDGALARPPTPGTDAPASRPEPRP